MIFTGPHYYLGLIQAALIVLQALSARFLAGRNKRADRIAIWVIGAYLLMYKMQEYGPFRSYPLDLSAMSYFLFGVAAFVPFRPLKAAASLSVMLSGFAYACTMTLSPESHVVILDIENGRFLLAMAMVNHNLMFAGGVFMCASYAFEREDLIWILGWFGFFFSYVILMVYGYGVDERTSSIIGIMDGTLVAGSLGIEADAGYFVGYYLIASLLAVGIFFAFFALNRAYRGREARSLPSPYSMPALFAGI